MHERQVWTAGTLGELATERKPILQVTVPAVIKGRDRRTNLLAMYAKDKLRRRYGGAEVQ